VTVEGEIAGLQWILRERREDGAAAARPVHHERSVPAAAIFQLVRPAAPHERVVGGVEREEHPYPAIRIGIEHQQVAIGPRPDRYLDPGTREVASILVEAYGNRHRRIGADERRREQEGEHGVLLM
jgi:hypothetical protein